MGFTDWLAGRGFAPNFSADADDVRAAEIDPSVFGIASYSDDAAPAPRISRRAAIQAAPVKRVRDLVPGVLGALPVNLVGPDTRANYAELLDQPEEHRGRSLTFTDLFEDMFFEGIAWWEITQFGWHNYPTKVRTRRPREVEVREGRVYVQGRYVPNNRIIRFDSPTDGLLISAARDIRKWLRLNAATERMADGTPPVDYFYSENDVDPFEDDDEVADFLDDWEDARRKRSTGFVPGGLKYAMAGWSPEQLQLNSALEAASLAIANHAGVDPEEVGVSTTSRTYQNDFNRRKNFTDFTLGLYRTAFEDRLRMGDVTPSGHRAQQDLDAFLRSDPLTRMQTADIALRIGAWDLERVRDAEGELAATGPAPKQQPAQEPANVKTSLDTTTDTTAFDTETMDATDIPGGTVFSVDVEKRTIRGRAVPYGVVGVKAGRKFQFSKGTVHPREGMRVKLWALHEKAHASGVVTQWDDTDDGLDVEFQVAKTPEGDRALNMADQGVWDGLSIGPSEGAEYALRGGVYHAVNIPIHEISLTPAPVFGGARVSSVAFDVIPEGNTPMKCTKCGIVHPDGVTECNAADVTAFEASQAGATTFDTQPIADAISAGFAALRNPQGQPGERQTIDPTEGAFEVSEPGPYRFDGTAGEHSLTDDVRGALFSNDGEATQRLTEFMDEAFAVTSSNTAALNPTKNRPDLYVPNLQFSTPLWDLVSTGDITDKTSFTVPKFTSAGGLVGPHTEGQEPTPGTFVAGSQTVQPTALSGKIEINREVLDQGGSPQADQIIWAEMQNAWYEAREARIATLLQSVTTTELNLNSAVNAALVSAFTSYFAGLQFVRGGNRFSALALDGKAFPALVDAKDSQGRPLLPILGATNAQGETSGGFDRVQIGNQTGRAAWGLGSGAPSRSFNFVPSSVWAWASTPKRFTFEYQVKSVDLAIWGYAAGAILRESDVKPIDYDVAD